MAFVRYGMGNGAKLPVPLMVLSSSEADAALHALQDASPGSLTVYVVPESSPLLPQVGSSALRCPSLRSHRPPGVLRLWGSSVWRKPPVLHTLPHRDAGGLAKKACKTPGRYKERWDRGDLWGCIP